LASRIHARFLRDHQGRVVVQDLKSKNGLWVNGEPATRCLLHNGDVVQIGGSFLVLRWVDATSAAQDAEVPEILGYSPAICALRHGLSEAAGSTQRVLLLGETGTGKDVAARALHRLCGRGEFVAVNCAALPETLAESLLFGHERGAYSGAQTAIGFFRAADGGTLFLDEVGELPLALQPKLLRAVDTQQVTPVGTNRSVPVQVRLIAATNRDLQRACTAEAFRLDLYMRLGQLRLSIAPLRERREDILLLMKHFMGMRTELLTPAVVRRLLSYSFPGNVRELSNVAVQLSRTGRLDLDGMGADPVPPPPAKDMTMSTAKQARRRVEGHLSDARARVPLTRERLEQVLRETGGCYAEAGRRLHLSRRQVGRKASEFGLRRKDFL
jgi:two-component system NtrC family response regulator